MPRITLHRFLRDEDGAVTVDWVVLTAAIVGMGILVVASVASGAADLSSGVSGGLAGSPVPGIDLTALIP